MRRAPFGTAQHVPNPVVAGVLPAKRASMVKGKNTYAYKLATKNTVERSNQIILLLQTYHALGIHSGKHGKAEAKWKELHSKFAADEMAPAQEKLLQNGDNKGRAPAMNTLKKWFSDWFKAYGEFAPTAEEGKVSSTGNPMDIDDFELGRKNFDILHVLSLEMQELKQNKADKKARNEADNEIGPSLRAQAMHRMGAKPAVKKRLDNNKKTKREHPTCCR
jgi:hypothetical protein